MGDFKRQRYRLLHWQTPTFWNETLTWIKMASLTAKSWNWRSESDFISNLTISFTFPFVLAVVKHMESKHCNKYVLWFLQGLKRFDHRNFRSHTGTDMLTSMAEEGKLGLTASVKPPVDVEQCTVSIIVWLAVLPVSKGTVALVRPLPFISEQTDPDQGWLPIFTEHLL